MTLLKRVTVATLALLIVVQLVGALLAGPQDRNGAAAEDLNEAAAFYEGARIKWIVPYSPGGGYDEYARLIAPYLEKYTAARVDVINLPGAGGMRGVNELFSVPSDGLTFGIVNGSALAMNQLVGVMDRDIRDLEYLARVVADTRVLAVSQHSPYASFADIMKNPQNVRIGATGLGGSTYVDAVAVKEAYGLDEMSVIHGFDSSSVLAQAMLRGNIHGRWGSWGSAEDAVDSERESLALQSGRQRNPALPDTPTALEFVELAEDPARARDILLSWEALTEVGRPVAAPPGTPPDRVAFLRKAFEQALNDPDLLERVSNAGRPILFLPGDEVQGLIEDALDMPPEVEPVFVKAIKGGV